MALHLIKIALFLLVNACGFYAIPVLINLAAMIDVLPEFPDGSMTAAFKYWLVDVGVWVWVAAAVASIGFFFTLGEIRTWLILSPLFAPLLYGIGIITYFNFV